MSDFGWIIIMVIALNIISKVNDYYKREQCIRAKSAQIELAECKEMGK